MKPGIIRNMMREFAGHSSVCWNPRPRQCEYDTKAAIEGVDQTVSKLKEIVMACESREELEALFNEEVK